ncbi:MAG: hypothetical protein QOD46_222 [Actinomycetota bacterium]|jgi:hypothetical protein|nr:hypothetical protein [Actinomycetota bacterium]
MERSGGESRGKETVGKGRMACGAAGDSNMTPFFQTR